MVNRRTLMCGAAALALFPFPSRADGVVALTWPDLLPEGSAPLPTVLQGLFEHDETALAAQQPLSSGIRTDFNGKVVSLSGFIVPLDFDGSRVAAFLLVPYVGACIHVPPPPANQLVLVTAETPYEAAGLFEAVTVTGLFSSVTTHTDLAEVGYAMAGEDIRPHRF